MTSTDTWRTHVEREPDRVMFGVDGEVHVEVFFIEKPRLRVHHFLQSDPELDPHDHPWDSQSCILDGACIDITSERELTLRAGDVIDRPAERPHRIELLDEDVWTLFKIGPYVRQWGFHTSDGWVRNDRYSRVGRYRGEA